MRAKTEVPRGARVMGVIGGLLSTGLCAAFFVGMVVLWAETHATPEGFTEQLVHGIASMGLAMALLTGLVLSVIMLPLLGLSIHAVVDALGRARGDSAGRLWLLYLVMGGGLLVVAWEPPIGQPWLTGLSGLCALVVPNVWAWRSFRRAHARASEPSS